MQLMIHSQIHMEFMETPNKDEEKIEVLSVEKNTVIYFWIDVNLKLAIFTTKHTKTDVGKKVVSGNFFMRQKLLRH